jgi:hypothetical protein
MIIRTGVESFDMPQAMERLMRHDAVPRHDGREYPDNGWNVGVCSDGRAS